MNPIVKQRWIDALRSGEFRQTTARLQRIDPERGPGFCCLGVLCELYRRDTGQGRWEPYDDGMGYPKGEVQQFVDAEEHEETSIPTRAVADWAGLDDPNPYHFMLFRGKHDTYSALTSANDNDETFETIAQMIEEQL